MERMRIYLAAPWTHRNTAAAYADALQARGHRITHNWWDYDSADDDCRRLEECAAMDLLGIETADALVVLNLETSEGKAVEQGYALAQGIPIFVLGKRSNIFQTLANEVTLVNTNDELYEALDDYAVELAL